MSSATSNQAPAGIDPRGPRFGAAITSLLLLVTVFLALDAATAGSASDNTDTATSPHRKILGSTVTKRLVSVCYRSLWHPKKTRNIKNLRDISQVSLWIKQVVCRQPCAATRSPLLCSLLSAER